MFNVVPSQPFPKESARDRTKGIWDTVGDAVGAGVGSNVKPSGVGDWVGDSVGDGVGAMVGASVGAIVARGKYLRASERASEASRSRVRDTQLLHG
jgi:hypothetical protein